MILSKFADIIQGHQITDEEIYRSNDWVYPIFTANNDIKGYWNNTIIKQNNLPCISYPTKGNKGVAFIQNKLFDANNTAIILIKDKYKDFINTEWLCFKLKNVFLKNTTSEFGVSYLNKEIVQNIELEIPKLGIQYQEIEDFKKRHVLMDAISSLICKIDNLKNKELILDTNSETQLLSQFLDYISRNDCLSEEGIYSLQAGFKDSIETITVMSGSSKTETYGYVPINNELHYIYNRPCLLCVTRGNAGKLLFLPKGIYATNTNAMLLCIREDKLAELDIKNNTEEENYLRFLKFNLESKFIQFSSNSDLSVFPMSVAIKDIEFCFNKYNQDVETIANLDRSLELITEKINLLGSKIENIN